MNAPRQSPPLTDDDLARLDVLLERANPEESMIVEEVDGFFAALACSPRPVPLDEWLPEVLGDDPDDVRQRIDDSEWEALNRLLNRHRESVAGQLYEGVDFSPVFAYDEEGNARGNAWAVGFVRGIGLTPEAWDALEDDEEFAESLDPVMQLVEEVDDAGDDTGEGEGEALDDAPPGRVNGRGRHRAEDEGGGAAKQASRGGPQRDRDDDEEEDDEDDEDDERKGGDVPGAQDEDEDDDGEGDDDEDEDDFGPQERRELIQQMIEGVMNVYEFFREERERNLAPDPVRRAEPKVGRNDPCPCGSGRKYKNCHGG